METAERFAALLAQIDRIPERADGVDPLAWNEIAVGFAEPEREDFLAVDNRFIF